jgi:hypothetical protein
MFWVFRAKRRGRFVVRRTHTPVTLHGHIQTREGRPSTLSEGATWVLVAYQRRRMQWLVFAAASALSVVRVAYAQVGVTVCACQPDFYEFTLDFALTCEDDDITRDLPGINDTSCRVSPVTAQNVTDQTPVVVTSVQILELGPPPALTVLFDTTIPLELANGGKFNYTSVAATPQKITPETLPSGLQMSIIGRNQNEEEVLNYWLIIYDNDCGIWPLLTVGQTIGWTVFSGLGTPSQFICPVAPSDGTDAPSDSPSSTPTTPAGGPTQMPQSVVTTDEPTFSGPSSSKDVPTMSPTVSCPPVQKKLGMERSRDLRVHSPTASTSCPEPPPKLHSMKKLKGVVAASKSKISKSTSSARSRRRV